MTEKFKAMLLKDVFANKACVEVIEKLAPALTKFPLAMVANRKAGEIFELAVTMRIVDKATRDKVVDELQKLLGVD